MNLLSLPNELFPLIFQYISTVDLLRTFGSLKHARLTTLVKSYISSLTTLDLSLERSDLEWFQNFLPSFSSLFVSLRVTYAQLFQLNLHLPSLRSLDICQIFFDINLYHLPTGSLVESLSLHFDPREHDQETALHFIPLLRSLANIDNHLRSLSITGCALRSPSILILGNVNKLQRLNLSIDCQASFEILLAVLPLTVRILTIKIRGKSNIPQSILPSWTPPITRCRLRELTLTAYEINYQHMEHTLNQQSHLYVLSLTISIRETEFINGPQFHQGLLRHLPQLTHLDFVLSMRTIPENSVNLEIYVHTFQDQPVLAYYNSSNSILTVCSQTCVSLDNVSIAFLDYQSNISGPIVLPRVRFLRFVTTEPLPLVLLHFVRQIAPRIHHLVLNGHYLGKEERISSLKEIPFHYVRVVQFNWIHNQSMGRVLLRLTPNVKELFLAGYRHDYSILMDNSKQLDRIRQQIHTITVEDYQNAERRAMNDNLKDLFPQARIVFVQ